MDASTFLSLLKNPQLINENQAEQLKEMLREQPYFSLAHQMISKYQFDHVRDQFDQSLKNKIMYVQDRSRFKYFLYNELEEIQPESRVGKIKKEIEQVDEKIKKASPEELHKELDEITSSYGVKTDYFELEKKEKQKRQEELMESFVEKIENNELSSEESSVHGESHVIEKSEEEESKSMNDKKEAEVQKEIPENIEKEKAKNWTEADAIIFYNEGNIKAAKEVYQQLILQEPSQREYYESQMEIMGLTLEQLSKGNVPDFIQHISTNTQIDNEEVEEKEIIDIDETKEIEETSSESTTQITEIQESEPVSDQIVDEIVINTPSDDELIPIPDISDDEQEFSDTSIEIEQDNEINIPKESQNIQDNPDQDIEMIQDTENRAGTDQESKYSEADAMNLLLDGKTDEAIEIYQALMLQYPEKKAYFESQIEILRS